MGRGGGVGGRWRTFEGITWSSGGERSEDQSLPTEYKAGTIGLPRGGGGGGESLEYYRALGGNNN